MSEFAIRALEIHSLYAWDYNWIEKCFCFMEQEGFNSLVLHRNDFVDLIIYPGKYFGCHEDKEYNTIFERYRDIFRTLYKYTPTRRSGPLQRRAFFKRVLERAKEKGFKVFIENKELYFPEIILEFYPELVKNGKICANDPFWWEFTKQKFTEFFEEFPEVDGIITAPATGESKVSIKSNRCTCELCRNTSREDWFRKLLAAMYEPIHKADKILAVRDFVFDPQAQNEIATVMEEQPEDVVICLKNTPHDYYPPFPENGRIGNVGRHDQWVEFDAMGQYFGWGICIADIMEDYRWRLRSCKGKGVTGIIVRTDWESLDGHTAFGTPNLMNMYSMGALLKNLDSEPLDIYDHFLADNGWYKERISTGERLEACRYFASLMSRTWDVTSRTLFVDCCVFSDSSLLPISYEHAFWLSEEKNSLKDWDPKKKDVLKPTRERIEVNIAEKKKALRIAKGLHRMAKKGSPRLKEDKNAYLVECMFLQLEYVVLYKMATEALLFARYIKETEEERRGEYWNWINSSFRERIEDLKREEEHLILLRKKTNYHPHVIYTMLDPDRVNCLRNDLEKTLGNIGASLC